MALYPEITPFHTGYLDVGDGHKIYYEQYGNPKGKPVVFIHGGPGTGLSSKSGRSASPKTTHIIAYDQRGAGKSKPTGETRANTTQKLVADLEKLRKHLNVENWTLFGTSWGSTLALAYAQAHAERVSGMVIGGVFLATRDELRWFTHPDGLARFYPQEYAALLDIAGNPRPANLLKKLFKILTGKDKKHARAAATAFMMFEGTACDLTPDRALLAADMAAAKTLVGWAALEIHYFLNNCFLKEGQLLKNIDRIAHIPLHIVQCGYDMVCPPAAALAVHAAHPASTLYWQQLGGHRANEEGLTMRVKALKDMLKKV